MRSASARSTSSIWTMLDTSTSAFRRGGVTARPVNASSASAAIRYCRPMRTASSRPSCT
jgi:hypothetical protein